MQKRETILTLKFKVKVNVAADSLHSHQIEGVELICDSHGQIFLSTLYKFRAITITQYFELHFSLAAISIAESFPKQTRDSSPRDRVAISVLTKNKSQLSGESANDKACQLRGVSVRELEEIHLKTQLHASAPARLSRLLVNFQANARTCTASTVEHNRAD